jgi:uncharacterized protein (UPF0276 family)
MGFSGIGLRSVHYQEILAGKATVDWFEIISENYMDTGGRPLSILEKIRADFPVCMHGVSLNIGSPDPINKNYLKRLKRLADRIQPELVTDHLCWGGVKGRNWHDLFPVPMTSEMIQHIAQKVRQVQDILERPIALENISTYLRFEADEMSEWQFTKSVLEEANCQLLLDINNAYVNAFNHGDDALEFIRNMPAERVVQYHLAGHSNLDDFLFDTHDAPLIPEVLKLFQFAVERIGPRRFLIEWDDRIPSLAEVETQAQRAQAVMSKALLNRSEAMRDVVAEARP